MKLIEKTQETVLVTPQDAIPGKVYMFDKKLYLWLKPGIICPTPECGGFLAIRLTDYEVAKFLRGGPCLAPMEATLTYGRKKPDASGS